MNPHQILLPACLVSLLLGGAVISEDLEQLYRIPLFFSEDNTPEYSDEWLFENSPFEETPQPSPSKRISPQDLTPRNKKPVLDSHMESPLPADQSGYTESARPEQRSTAGAVLTAQHHKDPNGNAFLTVPHQDDADRLAAIETSIAQLQATLGHTQLAIGIITLGVIVTSLYRGWFAKTTKWWFHVIRPPVRKRRKRSDKTARSSSRKRGAIIPPEKSDTRRGAKQSARGRHIDSIERTRPAAEHAPTSSDDRFPTGYGTPSTPTNNQHRVDIQHDVNDYPEIPEPIESVHRLIDSTNDLNPTNELRIANDPWHTGFARHIGPVRENQEDYVIALQVGDMDVCLLADGAGGHPLGEWGSYWGIVGGVTSIAQTLAFWPDDRELHLEKIARQAIKDASFAIASHAVAHGIPQMLSMRSTLIVVISHDDHFSWANLGDGGGWTIQATPRSFGCFLVPAKGEKQNILLSSLGPHIRGEISSGTKSWGNADLLVVASDGIADVIDHDAFFNACLATSLQNEGNLPEAAERVLQMLVESPDVSDNVSLGFVGRGRKPVLAV